MPLYALDNISPQTPPDGSYWIAPSAEVIGRVILERDVGIWYGAVLRGDNEPITVGEGTNVQEHCVFHTDPGAPLSVGKNCTIGHRALLHGCTIKNNCLIGIGSTILNNTIVGENCLIGAHTLLPEGKIIPDRSLVMGSPGKVVRELTEQEIERITLSAQNYILKWNKFQTHIKRIA